MMPKKMLKSLQQKINQPKKFVSKIEISPKSKDFWKIYLYCRILEFLPIVVYFSGICSTSIC